MQPLPSLRATAATNALAHKEEKEMTWKVALLAAVVGLTLTIASPASADFAVIYPDGSRGFEINLGFGLHAAAFWDIPGDGDIFVISANEVSDPLLASFFPGASGFAYWLDFLFFDEF